MYLSQEEKELISQEIEEIEKKTSVELVSVISEKSAKYKYESLIVNICIVSVITLVFSLFSSISLLTMFEIQIFTFLTIFIIFDKFENLVFYFIPKIYKYKLAKEHAHKQFETIILDKTTSKKTIMFFVSLNERYVEIITDENISLKLDNTYWEDIVDTFIVDVQDGQVANGYLKAMQACSEVLILNFPILENDINEFSNDVIEIRI